MRGTRLECHTAADVHTGTIPEPIGRAPATEAQYRAALAENVRHKADLTRARGAYQQRIRDRHYQPPKGTRIAFIVGQEERANVTAPEPDLLSPPILVMFRQTA